METSLLTPDERCANGGKEGDRASPHGLQTYERLLQNEPTGSFFGPSLVFTGGLSKGFYPASVDLKTTGNLIEDED